VAQEATSTPQQAVGGCTRKPPRGLKNKFSKEKRTNAKKGKGPKRWRLTGEKWWYEPRMEWKNHARAVNATGAKSNLG